MTDAQFAIVVGAGATMFGTLVTSIVTLVKVLSTKKHVKEIQQAITPAQQQQQSRTRPPGFDTAREGDARTRKSDRGD